MALLTVDNLRVHFGSGVRAARAVEDVSFTIGEQETVCLVGESGSGKTVTALAILGLIPSPPGEVVGGTAILADQPDGGSTADTREGTEATDRMEEASRTPGKAQKRPSGRDLLRLSDEELRRIRGKVISMVFQEPMTSLNPVFTIGDQIGEAITVHEQIAPADLQRRVIELLTDVGIPSPSDRVNDYPHQLSGGQRQRVMIAMALACNPRMVIADEPTTALDVTVQAQILHLFAELKAKRKMSLLYITHDLGVVATIADRIYVMYAGVIVEEGQAADIFYRPNHPYTQGLLASLPDRHARGRKLYAIPGSIPDPASKPTGCPFHPRCSFVINSCRAQFPAMTELGSEHRSRCPVLAGLPPSVARPALGLPWPSAGLPSSTARPAPGHPWPSVGREVV